MDTNKQIVFLSGGIAATVLVLLAIVLGLLAYQSDESEPRFAFLEEETFEEPSDLTSQIRELRENLSQQEKEFRAELKKQNDEIARLRNEFASGQLKYLRDAEKDSGKPDRTEKETEK